MSLGRGRGWGARGGEKIGIEYGAWFVTLRAVLFFHAPTVHRVWYCPPSRPRTSGGKLLPVAPPGASEAFNFGDWVGVRFLIHLSTALSCTCAVWAHENKYKYCIVTQINTARKARVCAHVLCASAVRVHRAHTHNCSGRGSAAVARAAVRTCDTSPVVGRWSLDEARGPGQATSLVYFRWAPYAWSPCAPLS